MVIKFQISLATVLGMNIFKMKPLLLSQLSLSIKFEITFLKYYFKTLKFNPVKTNSIR